MPVTKSKISKTSLRQKANVKNLASRRSGQTSKVQIKTQKLGNKKPAGLSVPIYSLEGRSAGIMELPKELFGAKVNKPLLAQAIRVYLNNQKSHSSHTKTRGEVKGSTRKIRAQKGTGGARHGSIKAPIFVGGGIALGPKFRKVILDLPKKMKKAAFVSALSDKMAEKEIIGISGLDKATGKTSQMAILLKTLTKKSILLVMSGKNDQAVRALRNLSRIEAVDASQVNILQLIKYQTLMLTKDAVEQLEARIKSTELNKKGKKK